MPKFLAPYSKAVNAFIGTLITGEGALLVDGDFTLGKALGALGAALVLGGGLVYLAPKNAAQ